MHPAISIVICSLTDKMSTTPIIRALAATAKTPQQSGSGKKRKITPSFEQSSSKRSLILVAPKDTFSSTGQEIPAQPFFAPKHLSSQESIGVAEQHSHAHPSSKKDDSENESWHVKHILLPFDLRDKKIDIFADDVLSLLKNIFPGTLEIGEGRCRSQLTFDVDKMPSGPWPLTIGGLPFTISSHDQGRGLICSAQKLGNLRISICQEYEVNFCESNLRILAADVQANFQENLPEIRILELIFSSAHTFDIVLEDHVSIDSMRNKLPGRIALCPVGYLRERDLCRPLWTDISAKRQIQPQPINNIIDDTVYDIIRPGVLLSSRVTRGHAHPVIMSTTAGILVQNSKGDRFMTGAYHGIENEVWQTQQPTRIIADVVEEIPSMDISILKLRDGIIFVNETFEDENGDTPKFNRFINPDDDVNHMVTNLNSPYTGNMEGTIFMRSYRFEGNDKNMLYNWTYMGQDDSFVQRYMPPDGICGSVIWDDDGAILGFIQHYVDSGPHKGYCLSMNATELARAGYTLVK